MWSKQSTWCSIVETFPSDPGFFKYFLQIRDLETEVNARSEELESVETGYRSEVGLGRWWKLLRMQIVTILTTVIIMTTVTILMMMMIMIDWLIDWRYMHPGKHIWSGRVLPLQKHARPHWKILPQCADQIENLGSRIGSNSIQSDPYRLDRLCRCLH